MQISSLIVDELRRGEKRVLGLVVAVRTALGRSERVKGDLSEMVKSALRKLVASETVVQVDGMYALSPPKSRIIDETDAASAQMIS